ncbi:MAG: DUF3592 domain-containing protein [Planctomycetota bacterium]|nr:DUF3592 domain-containing protein [Planctomycetota bacterium]
MEDHQPPFPGRPPRHLSLAIRLRLLLCSYLSQFGWFFFGFGMIFAWMVFPNYDPLEMVDFSGKLVTVDGRVVDRKDTLITVNDRRVSHYFYDFEYRAENFSGSSFSRGDRKKAGDRVKIEFPVNRPHRSRIEGMNTRPLPAVALFILVIPLLGLGIILAVSRRGLRTARLLRFGECTTGKLLNPDQTKQEIENLRGQPFHLEYQTDSGETYQAIFQIPITHISQTTLMEPLLYDPLRPRDSALLHYLPGSPRIEETGLVTLGSRFPLPLALLLPTLTIAGHGLAFYLLYLK